ncbi:hypothetical protein EJ05DRAFT_476797 [Pseudovirgaria hyperparasitica]|uniref:Autophagy-related protein 29 n=1 Tax=Pseudovirgaria hyperparasitica TaxID=470096 RepID=A0A6A6W3X2_9PEZI|nr:uncharacterized protein EJ05DRAFT_476797 [Pseudovirgaria hyperparasitica]KAF2757552.1 hypothetical protein EJ05DRAFT_476797 [Pseudovirgaria hyperparasitica]
MAPPQSVPTAGTAVHAQTSSTNVPGKSEPRQRRVAEPEEKVHFTALIRLPFLRGDFVDPPQVDWDNTRDQALWKIISRSSKASAIDWTELANKFQVPHTFLLQQAAWLYERHISHVRAQMRKVQTPTASTGIGSASSTTPVCSVPMKRLGSGGSRAPSSLSIRSKVEIVKVDGSLPGSPKAPAPTISRTPSTTTVTHSGLGVTAPVSPRPPHRSFRSSFPPSRKAPPAVPVHGASTATNHPTSPDSLSGADSSSSASSSDEEPDNPIRRSQIFKRPPRFTQRKSPLAPLDDASENDPDEDDSSNSDLPFAMVNQNYTQNKTPARQDPHHAQGGLVKGADKSKGKSITDPRAQRQVIGSTSGIESSASSASSAVPGRSNQVPSSPPPMSPRHRAELARLNPHKRNSVGSPSSRGKGKETGSDGTPSMGSSFSDLDDASVTQSALEEALLSNMQHGRMSTLSNLRSRYL